MVRSWSSSPVASSILCWQSASSSTPALASCVRRDAQNIGDLASLAGHESRRRSLHRWRIENGADVYAGGPRQRDRQRLRRPPARGRRSTSPRRRWRAQMSLLLGPGRERRHDSGHDAGRRGHRRIARARPSSCSSSASTRSPSQTQRHCATRERLPTLPAGRRSFRVAMSPPTSDWCPESVYNITDGMDGPGQLRVAVVDRRQRGEHPVEQRLQPGTTRRSRVPLCVPGNPGKKQPRGSARLPAGLHRQRDDHPHPDLGRDAPREWEQRAVPDHRLRGDAS